MKKQKLFFSLVVIGLFLVALCVWFWNASAWKSQISLERKTSRETSLDSSRSEEVMPVEGVSSEPEENSEKTSEPNEENQDLKEMDTSDSSNQPSRSNADTKTSEQNKPVAKASAPSSDEKKIEEPSKPSSGIVNRLVDFGFVSPSKPRTIDTIILHSSYDASGDDPYSVKGIIDQWKGYGVAPHYFVGRDGTVYRLVQDADIAYHAGVAKVPDGRTNVNEFSLGIEIANTKDEGPSDAQYSALKRLIASLKDKYKIKYVLGHDDIAPGRKTDPWNFDWKKL